MTQKIEHWNSPQVHDASHIARFGGRIITALTPLASLRFATALASKHEQLAAHEALTPAVGIVGAATLFAVSTVIKHMDAAPNSN